MRFYHQLLVLSLVLILGLTGCWGDNEITPTEPQSSAVPNLYEPDGCSIQCRMTGGGNAVDDGEVYTFGGQAGANTALLPQPKGEWTHHQKDGMYGSFVFHAGTASAPDRTEIDYIHCNDPGFCSPARHAPAKQIDFGGVGTFKNMNDEVPASIADHVTVGESLHYFKVNIDDAGEPGRSHNQDISDCPEEGFGLHGGEWYVDCDCFDFYRISIFKGEFESSGIMYQVRGYIRGGNFQIHPLTGFDQKSLQ